MQRVLGIQFNWKRKTGERHREEICLQAVNMLFCVQLCVHLG